MCPLKAETFQNRQAFFVMFYTNLRNCFYNLSMVRVPDEALNDHKAICLQKWDGGGQTAFEKRISHASPPNTAAAPWRPS